jgi:hypothetical protein
LQQPYENLHQNKSRILFFTERITTNTINITRTITTS